MFCVLLNLDAQLVSDAEKVEDIKRCHSNDLRQSEEECQNRVFELEEDKKQLAGQLTMAMQGK